MMSAGNGSGDAAVQDYLSEDDFYKKEKTAGHPTGEKTS